MGASIYQGSYGKGMKYDVDIVFCIDATASMTPVIDMVKRNVQRLPDDFLRRAQNAKKNIDNLRLRAILFRDYLADGEHGMEATDFFRVPEQQDLFNRIIKGIEVDGGGDEPEDGLEALAYAISSDWQKEEPGKKRRQVIVVLTDASTHPLGWAKASPFYDPQMPTQFETLSAWWGDGPEDVNAKMNYNFKRLLLFAPKADWWTTIHKNWENVILTPVMPGQGLKETDYEKIIDLLVGSI